MYQKENLLKMQQHLTGATQMPGLMIPPHFHNQFQGFQFRGFPGNFGGGRYPPTVRFHPGFDKPPFPPPLSPVSPHQPPGPGFGLLSPDHISMRWVARCADPWPHWSLLQGGLPWSAPPGPPPADARVTWPSPRAGAALATCRHQHGLLSETRWVAHSALGTRDRGWSHQTRLTLSVPFREYKGKNRLLLRAAQTASRN